MAALWAGLPIAALAQPAVPPAEAPPAAAPSTEATAEAPPVEIPRLPAAADGMTSTFRKAVAGSSLLVGVSRTFPTITILDVNDPSTDPSIEQYRGNGELGYTLSWHVGFADEPIAVERITERFYTGWTVRLAVELDTFTARQSLLRRAVGKPARGEITGNVTWGGVELLTLAAWENSVLPMAWTAGVYIGLAAVQFQGDLEFTSSGVPYKGTAASDGFTPVLVFPLELRWHLGPVVLRHLWLDSQFAVYDLPAKVEYRGTKLAKAAYQYTIGITTLGYAITY